MARRKAGQPINGWLVIDKPQGLTSAAAVAIVRRTLDAAKAGHGGTLDPLATGVLPIALGEATKTVSYIQDGTKIYRFTARWGEQRDTDDAEGAVVAVSDQRPAPADILAILPRFRGEIEQVPPRFSAVKVAGQRAYALARAEQPVDLAARTVRVDRIELVETPDPDHAVFDVVTGKGVYMRSLARDMAAALGTVGHVAALRRLAVGPFGETEAIPLDKFRTLGHSAVPQEYLLSVGAALAGIPAISLTEAEARRLQQGRPIAALPVASRSSLTQAACGGVVYAMACGRPVALAQVRGGEIRPLRILNL